MIMGGEFCCFWRDSLQESVANGKLGTDKGSSGKTEGGSGGLASSMKYS